MTLQQMKYAIEIANCGSMNEAAKKLFISQPSLSNSIKDLETEIGIAIFERNNRGISVSVEGMEFLGYARQVIEQMELMESRYNGTKLKAMHFSVSTQHYPFAADAFSILMNETDLKEYGFRLKETKTYNIVEDVKNLRSDVGILYINELNSKVMNKLFNDSNLKYTPLFNTTPHVLLSSSHPLSDREVISFDELKKFPYISFEQGDNNSGYFSEETLNVSESSKSISVSDRGTLYDLLMTTLGFSICIDFKSYSLNGKEIKSVALESNEISTVGWIAHKDIKLSKAALRYIEILNDLVSSNYFDLSNCLL